MMKFYTFIILIFLIPYHYSFAKTSNNADQKNLKVGYHIDNPTNKIDDAQINVNVRGGTPPYQFLWSAEHIPKNIYHAKNLREGTYHTVQVKDAKGQTRSLKIHIPCNSLSEHINSVFSPIVSSLEKIIFWDPFAYSGIYDPIMRKEDGTIMLHPNGNPIKQKIPIIVIWLVLGSIIFTISLRFISLRGFKHAIDLVRGKYDNQQNAGEVNHFQALTTALSGTVGLGNIAGVAIAISIGGPGATFWMICAGLLGMSSKFVECTLGVKYRQINADGSVSGGPMYYLRDGLKKYGLKRTGKVLSGLFALLAIGGSLGGGNMFQANQSFQQLTVIFPSTKEYGPYYGLILAVLVGVVIIGGIKKIAKVTDKIVPFMALIYVSSALVIIGMNIQNMGTAFDLIIKGAFAASALKGGIIGVLIVGVQRAAFSNEAGVGSAAIAHSAVKTDKPVTEGFVSLLEPFIDTVIICTMTALVIIFTGLYSNTENIQGTELTSRAFESVFSWYPYILLLIILLFAFSTMISWSYYGLKAFDFLFGDFFKKMKISTKASNNIYRGIFLLFIIVGSSSELGSVLDFSDMMILSMAIPNIIGLLILRKEVVQDLSEYWQEIKLSKNRKKQPST